ncbi:MAG: trehalose-phosphatase [Deltaproteobacteria bacterium GWA2_38_16]|nr:MAG: trehalose-phosphatase [Deltaproteobacteria bacterium GWA2_38_16]OGQ03866.1 MAG: trehalose-phosphatase [Deltaproteobacteria bacterium RIFCSPHIGHO2_02_FULL_38_15]OGQ33332.1 MAG: trehalose-phosphatase [Deltaproteobacteria bacterium RIFCSPLOWO2_01_FULL_38_9]OGQ59730.1 MAG: trehalose-phosphatase [Deltaproteobacteria bacterium RIFCSPLOWO2_12_FULL_38_8]
MKPFFTQAGLQKLKTYCHPQTLFAFDYDGTLTPLTSKISEARLPLKTQKLLETLYLYTPIVIVSGRSITDLKTLCSFTPTLFIGNHGLEGLKLEKKLKINFYKICKKWKKQLLNITPDIQGIELEDKKYSLSIHYRNVRAKVNTKALLLRHLSKLYPTPKIVFGKSVINILPFSKFNKGTSLKIAMHQLKMKRAIYVGDDQTDEDVFCLPTHSILKIRIGKKNNSHAHFYLKNHFKINQFLTEALSLFLR